MPVGQVCRATLGYHILIRVVWDLQAVNSQLCAWTDVSFLHSAPEVYLGALRHLSLSSSPEKCAMVAAHLYDLQGAARAGMKTIYIPRGDEQSNVDENSVRSKAEGGEVDLVVKSFVELADVLG